jgi:hypothetical protein
MLFGMEDAEIKCLRKEIHRPYGSSPHKKKYWLALLEMYGRKEISPKLGQKKSLNRVRAH